MRELRDLYACKFCGKLGIPIYLSNAHAGICAEHAAELREYLNYLAAAGLIGRSAAAQKKGGKKREREAEKGEAAEALEAQEIAGSSQPQEQE